MPVYEYKCRKCGKIKEVICNHSDKPESITCPHHWFETECEIDMSLLHEEIMYPIISTGSFVINGYNEKNGYSGGTE